MWLVQTHCRTQSDSMSDRIFDFDSQLKLGTQGENHFLTVYGVMGWQKGVEPVDFILPPSRTAELKTDDYDMEVSPNFFMEFTTDSGNGKKPGGPWRARNDKIDFFVYYFIRHSVFFWFRTDDLCKFLDDYVERSGLSTVPVANIDANGTPYHALGYKIPRRKVQHLVLKEHRV